MANQAWQSYEQKTTKDGKTARQILCFQKTRPTYARRHLYHHPASARAKRTKGRAGIYLLGLEAEAAGLVRAGGPGEADDRRLLPVLPAADALHEAHHIGLLPPP